MTQAYKDGHEGNNVGRNEGRNAVDTFERKDNSPVKPESSLTSYKAELQCCLSASKLKAWKTEGPHGTMTKAGRER